MDNLGDWLYIVFLAIAVISGLFGSSNKKKKDQQPPLQQDEEPELHPETEKGKGFWEILEEMQKSSKKTQEEVVIKEVIPQQQKPKRAYQSIEQKKAYVAPTSFLDTEKNIPEMEREIDAITFTDETDNYALSVDDLNLKNLEEVRKAVIYSEVLNRKYS